MVLRTQFSPCLSFDGEHYPTRDRASSILGISAVFGPAIAAFVLTYFYDGGDGIKRLWSRGWRLDFEKKWLIPSCLLLPAIALSTIMILLALGQTIPWQDSIPTSMVVPVFLITYFTNALPEEYGWRGYALTPLQSRWNPLFASLILGAVWGLWHLPLHFISGTTQEIIPIWQIIVHHMALAIVYTWIFNRTKGSVLVASLLHATSNIAGATLPYWTTGQGRLINFAILLVGITMIAFISKPKHLGKVMVDDRFPEYRSD